MKLAKLFAALAILSTPLAAFAAPASGLMLGVNVFQNWQGLRVVSTIPGYAAEGVLFKNDVIVAMADVNGVYPTRTLSNLEWAKDRIGPFEQAAIKVVRPGWGEVFFFVTLEPVGGSVVARTVQGQAGVPNGLPQQQKMKTTIRRSDDARQLFQRRGGTTNPFPIKRPGVPKPIGPQASQNPADFFNR